MIESLGFDSDMGKIVDNGSLELTFCKVNDGQIQQENNVDEGAKIRHNVAADNNEPGRNRRRSKHQKFRLLSDVYKVPASELRAGCDRTNSENINRRLVTEFEDDDCDDDATLAAYFNKQKGVEVTDSTLKKRNIIGVEEPSVDQGRKSNHGFKDSISNDSNVGPLRKKSKTDDMDTQTMADHKKDFRLQCSQKSNQFAEVSSKEVAEKENEDSEMEAVMLLARHFNEEKQILRECRRYPQSGACPLGSCPLMVGPSMICPSELGPVTSLLGLGPNTELSPVISLLGLGPNTTCACVKKSIRDHSTESGSKPVTKTSSKTATKHPVKKITKEKLENVFCSVQKKSFIRVKAATSGGSQSYVEMSMTKAAGAGPDAQNHATLVCSFNRNPADFSMPNGENKFMRGG